MRALFPSVLLSLLVALLAGGALLHNATVGPAVQASSTIAVGSEGCAVTPAAGGVRCISAGGSHTCAVTTGGGVKCWGLNHAGQLGDNTTAWQRNTPTDVFGLSSDVAAVSAGVNHTCAVTTAGGAKCWGSNLDHQLGDVNTTTGSPRRTPIDVVGLSSGVAAVSGGSDHTCALIDGGVECWGQNYRYGQLGDGTTTDRFTPTGVSGLSSDVTAIAAGAWRKTCALNTTGGVKCWGSNSYGQLGIGTISGPNTCYNLAPCSTAPVAVSGLALGVAAVSVGGERACALTTAGAVQCWGWNAFGALGDNTTSDRYTPTGVVGLSSGVTAIAAGYDHTCALKDGGVKCWGHNSYGQLGDNTVFERHTPVDVVGMTSGVSAIAAGTYYTCALMAGGGVKCWGKNGNGELGDDTTFERHIPVDVFGLPDTVTPSPTPTPTPSLSATPTPTPCPTDGCDLPTPTPTATPVDQTPTPPPTPTPCPTDGCDLPTPSPTASPTPTPCTTNCPSITPTPTPSPTPSPTATPRAYSGDVDCSGGDMPVSAVDSLKVLRFVAGLLPVNQYEPCTDISDEAEWGWKMGDVDCSGAVTAVDSLKILRYVAGLSVSLPGGCPAVG